MTHIQGLNCKYLFRVKNIFKKRQKRYCAEEKGFYICTRYGGIERSKLALKRQVH